ncbi:MAG: DUF2203 domain-containing protein [Streptosporangiales bacterium]|nr:DUF2203 domain-containing protein [Streptosporangiales bacterium]
MPHTYTVAEARVLLADMLPVLDEIVTLRADVAELGTALRARVPSGLGGLPELKGAQARIDELLTEITEHEDVQLKGIAPLLLDFPAELSGESVLLCWLEGDADLAWYHRVDLGFAGRRRLSG